MKKVNKLIVLAMSLVMALSLGACGNNASLDKIIKSGKLIVATSPDFPPFEYMEGSEIVGWDIDVAKQFATDIGVTLEVQRTDFDGVLAAPATGKADIGMAGISYSAERAKNVAFTNTVFKSRQVIIIRDGDTSIKTLADLAGKKVGGQRGTVGFNIADGNEDWAFDGDGNWIIGQPKEAKAYDTGALAVQDLINNKIDAVIIDTLPANKFVAANADAVKIVMDGDNELSVMDDEYAFIVKKDNDTLVNKLNELITKYKADGTFDRINDKFFK